MFSQYILGAIMYSITSITDLIGDQEMRCCILYRQQACYADAAVFWDSATMYSQYIPGAIMYSVKSIPDLIGELEQLGSTKMSNDVAFAKLVGSQLHRHHTGVLLQLPLACIFTSKCSL